MKFHVIPWSDDQIYETDPPIEESIESLTGKAWASGAEPIKLRCDVVTGGFPGFPESRFVYLLNDAALDACKSLNLKVAKTIDHTELPDNFVALPGSGVVNVAERQFEPHLPNMDYKEVRVPVADFQTTVDAHPDWTLDTKFPIVEGEMVIPEPPSQYKLVFRRKKSA